MYKCNCGKEFEKQSSLNSHARFCVHYVKKKKQSIYKKIDGFYECECGKIFEKSQGLNAHFSHCKIHRGDAFNIRTLTTEQLKKCGWSKGLTKETSIGVKKYGETYKKRFLSGEIIPSFLGKHHTVETREKISNANTGRNNGYVKTKWYDVHSSYLDETVKVQGTWELHFAERLNSLNVNWIRCNRLNINYVNQGVIKNYIPDFYLPDFDLYIEVKGFWFKSTDGRVDDRLKMQLVIEQNTDKSILIIDSLDKIKTFSLYTISQWRK